MRERYLSQNCPFGPLFSTSNSAIRLNIFAALLVCFARTEKKASHPESSAMRVHSLPFSEAPCRGGFARYELRICCCVRATLSAN